MNRPQSLTQSAAALGPCAICHYYVTDELTGADDGRYSCAHDADEDVDHGPWIFPGQVIVCGKFAPRVKP